jgi:hypothetical protein
MTTELTGDQTTAQDDTDTGEGTGQVTSWLDALPDDLKGNDNIKSFESPEAMAKAYLETQGKLPVIPETPEAYEIPIDAKDPVSEALATNFRQWAHKEGLSAAQAKNLAADYDSFGRQVIEAADGERKLAEEKSVALIQKEWGSDFDANLSTAKKAMARFGGEEFAKYLEETRLGNHPAMLRTMLAVGQAISEDKLEEGTHETPGQVKYTKTGTPIIDDYPYMKQTG